MGSVDPPMRRLVLCVVLCGLASGIAFGAVRKRIASHGIEVVVPTGWRRVRPGSDAPVTDPRTLLVVGTNGVRRRASQCQLTRYRLPPGGAVVVVVGWSSLRAAGGDTSRQGRRPLKQLTSVRPHLMECFPGRAAVADLRLGAKPYQVNVMVGNRATAAVVSEALMVARSFNQTR